MAVVLTSAMAAIAATASAQTPGSERGFVGGLGGITFGTVTSGAVGGQVGMRVGEGLFVIGEVGRMFDVLPREIQDDLDEFVDILEDQTGLPVEVDLRAPATYAFGGVLGEAGDGQPSDAVRRGRRRRRAHHAGSDHRRRS
jgi:hypothetical protein